jgi:hypothetical protein
VPPPPRPIVFNHKTTKKKPHAWNPCTQTFHNNVFNHKTTKKALMLEVMHTGFPRNNLFRRKTTKECIPLQPMHFILTKDSFCRMGVCQPFSWQFSHSYFIFRNVETLFPKINLKEQNFDANHANAQHALIKENCENFHFQSNIFKIK